MPILHGMGDSTFTNHLLIAMPTLNDPNFAQAVTLVCEHTDKGALGIVLNKPLPMKLSDVLTQMQLEPSSSAAAPCTPTAVLSCTVRGASGTTLTRFPKPSR
jgi:putative AlgH/UPF0301 family transcriptional regulator